MATYVLVHGGWGGGWEWTGVAERLRSRGHVVFTPTLTGMGERAHLARPEIDLETHVEDVRAVLWYENLDDVILLGHSYSGAVVTGVADRVPERLRRLVYLDAFVPLDGQSEVDCVPRAWAETLMLAPARDRGDGWRIPSPFREADLALPAETARWYAARLTDQPLATCTQPLRLTGDGGAAVPRTYVHCVSEGEDPRSDPFLPFAQRAQELGWDYRRLEAAHDAHVAVPDELVAILHDLATRD